MREHKLLILIFYFNLFVCFNFVEQNVEAFSVNHMAWRSASEQEEPTLPIEEKIMLEEEEQNNGNDKTPTSSLLGKCDPCPESIVCVPQIQCPAHVRMKDHEKPQICDLPGGTFGFCCVTGQNHTGINTDKARMPSSTFLPLSIVEEARLKLGQLMHHVAMLPVQQGHPDFFHGIAFHSTPKEDIQNFHLSNSAMQQVITSQIFTQKEQIPIDDIITNNLHVDFKDTPLAHHCAPPHHCRNPRARYRSFDGSCNNPLSDRSLWGAAGQPMERLLPPAYEDGIWTPRMHSVDGKPLLGARETSRKLIADVNRPHPKHNLLVMQFGQFIAHDVSQTASVRWENGDLVQCCSPDGLHMLPKENRHFACLPIDVSPDDEFYSTFNVRCMNFVRLSLYPHEDCKMRYGKQRSKVTHFLDASPVYGSSMETAQDLRVFQGGRLRMLHDFGRDLLPLTNDKKTCGSESADQSCFKSGDGRTNQIISLITTHILFAREHNRIAGILHRMNPQHSDEQIFQEARRILIAELQHIIYNEYLPIVVGAMQMKRFRLVPLHHGYSSEYSDRINPAITNEFSGAAFRMGHSSVDGKFHLHHQNNVDEVINIPDVMFNPSRMRKRSFYDNMLNTLVFQPMQTVDTSVTRGLSRFLFRGHNPFGIDLAAINIQRGRDQGLHCYNDYLELMGHRKLRSFKQLPSDIAQKLSKVYNSPDDIDLWIGGLLEKAVPDGIVGITFAEIIADQFSRFKHGDRYYYEYNKHINPGAFNLDQLHEIRKVTMARLICDNSDHLTLTEVPPAAFVRADFPGNQPVRCNSPQIPIVNLEAWRA
ncbi:chorion peroxidase [Teleopsis dalmanni]|uniref:chorion peroxidase n=1 Tax=Teleopsis dalmanni TaxID=139649 RepID=UPI0018CD541C|nr:chorion peroxidase [Teleopsis dalmanni]